MTGTPNVRCLIKPIMPADLLPVVDYAVRMCRMARVKREALRLAGNAENRFLDGEGPRATASLPNAGARHQRTAALAARATRIWRARWHLSIAAIRGEG